MTLIELIQDKVSKRQLVAVAALYCIMQPDLTNTQLWAIAAVAVATVASYTVLAWKHGREPQPPQTP